MHSPFFSTHADRVALARKRYFEEGLLPSGIVSEAVFQSWSRCLRGHHDPRGAMEFQPVSQSRAQLVIQQNRLLIESWDKEAKSIEAALGATNCAAMLTDSSGVIVGSACVGRQHEKIIPASTRLGVTLAEDVVGTTAPGIVARTGQTVSVSAGEHFFEKIQTMYCAAAPIRDIHGKLAGVLDVSSEGSPFAFDAASVVGVFAATIENRLLVAQSHELLVLRIQISPSLLSTPMAGLIGIDFSGKIVWKNAIASRLLGLANEITIDSSCIEDLLDCRFADMASVLNVPVELKLPTGLRMYAQVESIGQDGYRNLFLPARPEGSSRLDPGESVQHGSVDGQPRVGAPADNKTMPEFVDETSTLRKVSTDLILQTLNDCGGNISAAAKRLKVSRGLLYRRLRSATSQE